MKKIIRACKVFVLILALLVVAMPAYAATSVNQIYSGSGAIRSMTTLANGTIVGGRSSGHEIEVWSSGDKGSSWNRIGTVASNQNIDFGDVMFMAVPGTYTVYCAFRERDITANTYAIVICRSDNGGADWAWDSTVIGGQTQFVGAPWLFIANNGDMQCYYDSEPMASQNGAPGSQWIAMQGRNGLSGDWNKYGVVAASRDGNISKFVRDGMASVVDLGNNRIMLVTEGIEDNPSGGVYSNVVRAIQSFDGGVTWDYAGRRIVYQCGIDGGSGRRYNAYCPVAVRVGGGPVGVVFCTDEDFGGTPDMSNADVAQRRTHIKYIKTMDNFETWGDLTSVWTGGQQAYAPGAIETASNELLITIDHFYGNQSFHRMGESASVNTNTGSGSSTPGLDGVYYIKNVNSGKYLDVSGVSAENGANIHQWSFTGASNQMFKLESDGNGYYSIRTGVSNYEKAVDIDGWGTSNGTNILQWEYHGGDCQKFQIEKSGDYYVIKTKITGGSKCLDVEGPSVNDGANVHQWDVYGGAGQLWVLEAVGASGGTSGGTAQNNTLDGVYYLRNVNSGKYLDVSGVSADNGANIHQWSFTGASNQKFKLVSDGNGYYSIMTGVTDYTKAVDIDNWGTHDGANIIQWEYHGGDCQKYQIEKSGDYYVIKTKITGGSKCLDVEGPSTNDGANVHQWNVYGGTSQLWVLERVN